MEINTYRFRAECQADVEELKKILPGHYQITPQTLHYQGKEVPIPDVEVLLTTTKSLQEVFQKMKSITDGHVMAETVQFVTEYTGIRRQRGKGL